MVVVIAIPDEATKKYLQRNTTMKVSKCPWVFQCAVSFEEYDRPLNLPLEVLQMLLGKDVVKIG